MAAKTKTQATGKTPAPVSEPKPIRLPLTVMPSKNGKRKTMVSAAPEGEMPIARTGLFADRHALLDEVWGELQHRQPQVVKADQSNGNGKPKTEAPLTGGRARAEQEQAEFETEAGAI